MSLDSILGLRTAVIGMIHPRALPGSPRWAGSILKKVRGAAPGMPLLVGSGATADNAAELLPVADGLIVGTSVKRDGVLANPVDAERVRRLVDAARGARS